MNKKTVSGMLLTLLLVSVLTLAFDVQPAKANGTIYIRADGSIDPPSAPISSVDNVTYTLTADIYDSIVVERDNIVVDGAGYTVQGAGSETGIDLSSRSNVTLENVKIRNFERGIYLRNSSYCTIINNNLADNQDGVTVESIGEVVVEKNEISNSSESGIVIIGESNILVKENTIKQNKNGIATDDAETHSGIVILGNMISHNQEDGIYLYSYGEGGYYGPPGYGYIHNVVISSNNISYNQEDGISLCSNGYNRASMSGSGYGYVHNVTVTSNDILGNGRNGIYIYSHGYGEGWAYSVYTGEGWGHGYIYDVTIDFNNITSNSENGVYVHGYGYGFGEADRFGTGWGFSYIYDLSFSSNIVSSNLGNGVHIYSYGGASGSGSLSSSGYGRGRIYNVIFHSNNVSHNSADGIYLHSYGKGMGSGGGWGYVFNATLFENIVSLNNANGLHVEASNHNTTLVYDMGISKNSISANSQKGVLINGGSNANLTYNAITSNAYGVFYDKTTNNAANYNNICDNTFGMNVTKGATVNAEYNYWGNASGPYHPLLNPTGKGSPVNGDGTDLDFIPFLSAPVPPKADFSYSPQFPDAGTTITFNPSTTYDIDGSIVEYKWDFGDGNITTAYTPIILHVYMALGTYTVNLTVIDNDGMSGSIAKPVTVKHRSSITLGVYPSTVMVGSSVTINGTITPTRVHVNITISYILPGRTWITLAKVKTDSNSHYTYTWKTTDEGIYEIKASWLGDENTWLAESETKTVGVHGRVYIRPDGSIDPPCAPIQREGNIYTLTGNTSCSIVVQRNNVVLDGDGYSVSGKGVGVGLELSGLSNVTLENVKIRNFERGIYLRNSSYCTIINNNLADNQDGVTVESIGEVVVEKNEISNSSESGIVIIGESNVLIKENTIKQNKNGIATDDAETHSGIVIVNNIISSNREYGIVLWSYGGNRVSYIYNVTVSSNTVLSNNIDGIYLYSVGTYGYRGDIHNVTFSSNTVSLNSGTGVHLHSHLYSNITFSSNTVSSNQENGIYMEEWGLPNAIQMYDVAFSSNTISSNGGTGIYICSHGGFYTNNVVFSSNIVSFNNGTGIHLEGSHTYSISICGVAFSSNIVSSNGGTGIYIYSTTISYSFDDSASIYDVVFSSNTVSSNKGTGICLYSYVGDSRTGYGYIHNVTLSSNTVSYNSENGIHLHSYGKYGYGYIHTVNVCSNTLSANNGCGLTIDANTDIQDVTVYHNSLISNTNQAHISESNSVAWDDGYPSGGNYWGDYIGIDLYNGQHQNESGSDGIGDAPYLIDGYNQDRYPLIATKYAMYNVGPLNRFGVVWEAETYYVNVVSSSTVEAFQFRQSDRLITFNVTGPPGTIGYCNVTIPNGLLNAEPWIVLVNGSPPESGPTRMLNATHTSLYFTYSHSKETVEILGTIVVPEFPTWTSILIVLVMLMVATIIYKRRLLKAPIQ